MNQGNNTINQETTNSTQSIQFVDYALQFHQVIDSTKRIGRINITVDELTKLLGMFDIFNLVDPNTYAINNVPMSRIEIPSLMKGLVFPMAVTFGGTNHLIIDYLARPIVKGGDKGFNLSEFNYLIDKFLSNFKTNASTGVTNLEALKIEMDYHTHVNDFAVNGLVKPVHDYVIPVPVTTSCKYVQGSFYTEPVLETIIEAFRKICRELGNTTVVNKDKE